ncbi:retrovirus-related pol polyprotein from transposon TNT 1-94 [Tanacetum coccineum]
MAVRDFKKFFKIRSRFVRQPRNDKKTFQRSRDDKNGKSDRKCFRCGDPNHLIGECPKLPKDKNQRAFVGGSWSDSGEEDDEKWIKDSGCSKHMKGNRKLFSSYKAYNGGNVIFGSNLRGNIIGKGQICDNKCRVTFSEHDSEITKNGKVIGRGIMKKGLYVMKLENKPKDQICLATIDENSTLWHRRLGHANMRLIQSLASKELVRNLPKLKFDQHFCDACKIGKQSHASHKAKNIVSTIRCLELLHMDLFGPSAVRSYGENCYTLVIVDDYSRYTWTRFLKDKTEAFDQFEIFSKKIQNQLGCTIVSIRTDHGRKFDNEVQFGEFCNANGITHNFSAPRTPQSNGVVERKNRTLQEMSRTMKVEESLNVTFDETPPPSKTSPLVDDDLDEEEAIKVTEKKNLENDIEDETLKIDKIVNIKESRNHPLENVIGNLNQRTLRSQAQNQSNFFCFISTIEPKNVNEALTDDIEISHARKNKSIYKKGVVSRNKARLIAQGYNQQEGIDYDETYNPVSRLESIRILLAYTCALDFKLFQMDVKSAFLNGLINEEVYVAQPSGFIDFEKPNHVYKLKKALYGLKQAPKAWYDRLKAFLIKHEYKMGMFELSMMGELNFFLGLQIKQMKDDTKLTKDEECELVYSTKYRGMIGSLLYLTASRPDIMFSVCLCVRFQEYPKTSHLEAVKRIFRCVKGTTHSGLWYPKGIGIETVNQTALAISTTEAKYESARKACQQALWMKQALIDYDIRLDDVLIMCDNKGAINLSKNPVQHSWTKHIEIHHHFLQDNVQKGHISIEKASSVDNIADILTKPLKNESFNCLRFGLGMMEHIPQIVLLFF